MYGTATPTSPAEQLGCYVPNGATRESKMLAAGSLTITARSRKSGQHITLRLRCSAKNDGPGKNWPTVLYPEASHIFIDDFDGERIATYYPYTGKVRWAAAANANCRWTVAAVLRHYAGEMPGLPEMAELHAAQLCGCCGRQLTDPESIDRGIGPDCWGKLTGSKHAAIWTS